MIISEVDSYSYLWIGVAPDWHLRPLPRQTEAMIFFEEGILGRDILKIKSISSEYAAIPTAELLSKLKGMMTLNLGAVRENAAIRLKSKCKQFGVELRFVDSETRYVIVNDAKNLILTIEDNDVYREVKERMLKTGVPVLPAE